MSDNVFEYQLKELLDYSSKGNKEKTGCILMRAPSTREYDESEAFGQTLMQAITDSEERMSDETKEKARAKKETKKGTKEDEDGEAIEASQIRAIVLSSNRSPQNVAKKFKTLAVMVGTLDDSGTKLKESHLDKMLLADFLNLMYGYAAYFIIPSLLNAEEQSEDKD